MDHHRFKGKRRGIVLTVLLSLLLVCGCTRSGVVDAGVSRESTPATEATKKAIPAIEYKEEEEAVASGVPPSTEEGDLLRVRFIDVGQGDCALVTCGNHSMLIDGGDSGSSSEVYAILARLDIGYLDCIVSTHPDSDHCGGIPGALEYAQCGVFYSPVSASDTKRWEHVVSRLESQGVSITIPSPGDVIELGSARVTFLGPVCEGSSENNNSIVLRIDHGENSFLFTGDAECEEELSLVSSGANLDADVLKVGHHGSSSSSCRAFLSEVSPSYAVISVGDNGYGHPDPAVISSLSSLGIETHRTDEEGHIVVISNGKALEVEAVRGNLDE